MTRAALLGQIMANFAKSIAVAGTHGKTTTTSMLTHILLQADTDPTVSVGGMLDRIGGNLRVGHSDLFLTEACEYTNSFLEFYPCLLYTSENERITEFEEKPLVASSNNVSIGVYAVSYTHLILILSGGHTHS